MNDKRKIKTNIVPSTQQNRNQNSHCPKNLILLRFTQLPFVNESCVDFLYRSLELPSPDFESNV